MDKSSRLDIPVEEQRRMWNRWNSQNRERAQGVVSLRQAETVERWLGSLGRADLDIIDVGCGAGWLCGNLQRYGRVVGTDLADEVLERARARFPSVRFVAGDFLHLNLAPRSFDVAVTLEVLSHVADQSRFLEGIARLLRPYGLLMLATQNRTVLERWTQVGAPEPGQIRNWVDASSLRALLEPAFEIAELTSILPVGDQGLLRFVNSAKLNRLFGLMFGSRNIERMKERLLFGHTLMTLARVR